MAAAPSLAYEVVDVFTRTPFAGNPLAVVLDADELPDAQLQALAREFALSETAFPVATDEPGADYRLRIFTPEVELPFAGHPSVGAAWVMARLGRVGPGRVVQSCGAGLLPLEVGADGGPVRLDGGPPSYGEELDPAPLLAAVGLDAADLAGPAPRACGTGIDFAYLLVHDDAVGRLRPDLALLRAQGRAGVCVASLDGRRAHARVFAAGVGVGEDPATGSAALGLGVLLAGAGLVDGAYVVEQGLEMGRPSEMRCTVELRDGAVVRTTVEGDVVPVARGEVRAR